MCNAGYSSGMEDGNLVCSACDAGKYNGGEIFFDEFVVAVSAGFADLKDGSTSLSNGLARLAMAEKLAEATTTLIGRTFLVFFLLLVSLFLLRAWLFK